MVQAGAPGTYALAAIANAQGYPSPVGPLATPVIEGDLLAKINSTLEPLLGTDRFRAGVSVECDFTGGEPGASTTSHRAIGQLQSNKAMKPKSMAKIHV